MRAAAQALTLATGVVSNEEGVRNNDATRGPSLHDTRHVQYTATQ